MKCLKVLTGMFLGIVMLTGFIHAVQAQLPSISATSPTFEVATIKPMRLAGGVTGGCHGIDSKFGPNDPGATVPLGRCVIAAGRLSHLMSIAYSMPLQRISGFPEWDGPSRFDIEAKVENPSTATEHQLLLMLQGLLTDRFKLTLHHNMTEVPIFVLVVGKNGPKLQVSQQDAKSGFPEPKAGGLVFKGYSMPDLAEFLSNLPSVGRPVQDMTGLKGRFDFTLNVLDSRPESIGDLKMALMNWQSTIDDVQAQLGLKFESQKGSVESLVIDHSEKPQLN